MWDYSCWFDMVQSRYTSAHSYVRDKWIVWPYHESDGVGLLFKRPGYRAECLLTFFNGLAKPDFPWLFQMILLNQEARNESSVHFTLIPGRISFSKVCHVQIFQVDSPKWLREMGRDVRPFNCPSVNIYFICVTHNWAVHSEISQNYTGHGSA